MIAAVLSQRTLNRSLLARQSLLERSRMPAADALEHLVGLQAQNPGAPYVGLWTRLEEFHPEELSRLIEKRKAVRIALMRSTIHLVTARDALRLRPVMQGPVQRPFEARIRTLEDIGMDTFLAQARALVEEQPRTQSELGALLAERFPDHDRDAMALVVRALLPLVQVPPRGLWQRSGAAAHTSAEAWLGKPLGRTNKPDDVVVRYLRTFGPASVGDMQMWSGLTRLREVVDTMRSRLRTYKDEAGNELFDVPDGKVLDAGAPAPVRFLPEYDNTLMGHADRTRVISDGYRMRIFTRGSLLIDGFARGMWTIKKERGGMPLLIEVFERISPAERAAVEDEGAKLVDFVAPPGVRRDVRFTRF